MWLQTTHCTSPSLKFLTLNGSDKTWTVKINEITHGQSVWQVLIYMAHAYFSIWQIVALSKYLQVFPGGSVVKNLPAMQEDAVLIPGPGRSRGEGNGPPLQYSFLENPKDGGAWQATVHGVRTIRTQLSDRTPATKCLVSLITLGTSEITRQPWWVNWALERSSNVSETVHVLDGSSWKGGSVFLGLFLSLGNGTGEERIGGNHPFLLFLQHEPYDSSACLSPFRECEISCSSPRRITGPLPSRDGLWEMPLPSFSVISCFLHTG